MRQLVLLSGFCAVLAACGSSSGIGISGNPTINTNPNSPQPTEKLGQFTANRTLNLSAATLRGNVSADSQFSGVSSSQEGFGTNVQLDYDAVSGKYGLKINQGGISRTLAPVTLSLSGPNYTYSNESGSTTETLSLVGWGQAPLNLSYVTFGAWGRAEANGNTGRLEFAVAAGGVATTPADMPKTGSVTYTAQYGGTILAAGDYGNIGGTGTVNADFATGKVESNFNGNAAFAVNRNSGAFNFTSSASIASGGNSYSGTATGTPTSLASGMSGTLSGGFFGPGAVETGGSFKLEGNNLKAIGAFVGSKRQ